MAHKEHYSSLNDYGKYDMLKKNANKIITLIFFLLTPLPANSIGDDTGSNAKLDWEISEGVFIGLSLLSNVRDVVRGEVCGSSNCFIPHPYLDELLSGIKIGKDNPVFSRITGLNSKAGTDLVEYLMDIGFQYVESGKQGCKSMYFLEFEGNAETLVYEYPEASAWISRQSDEIYEPTWILTITQLVTECGDLITFSRIVST